MLFTKRMPDWSQIWSESFSTFLLFTPKIWGQSVIQFGLTLYITLFIMTVYRHFHLYLTTNISWEGLRFIHVGICQLANFPRVETPCTSRFFLFSWSDAFLWRKNWWNDTACSASPSPRAATWDLAAAAPTQPAGATCGVRIAGTPDRVRVILLSAMHLTRIYFHMYIFSHENIYALAAQIVYLKSERNFSSFCHWVLGMIGRLLFELVSWVLDSCSIMDPMTRYFPQVT